MKTIILQYKINFLLCDIIKSSEILSIFFAMHLMTSVTQAMQESNHRIRVDNELERVWNEVTVVS